MYYVNMEELAFRTAIAAEVWAKERPLALKELHSAEKRILAYIAPRAPKNHFEVTAVQAAVVAQFEHECMPENQQVMAMPAGVKKFSAEGFSAELKRFDGLFPCGLDISAKSALTLGGLMYRGGVAVT